MLWLLGPGEVRMSKSVRRWVATSMAMVAAALTLGVTAAPPASAGPVPPLPVQIKHCTGGIPSLVCILFGP
ncbi:MAG: hypothetical protein QOK28_769 [Actinomycetota bacterium]|jgi:hypothetical protein